MLKEFSVCAAWSLVDNLLSAAEPHKGSAPSLTPKGVNEAASGTATRWKMEGSSVLEH